MPVNNIARWDGMAWSALSGSSGSGLGYAHSRIIALTAYDAGSGPELYAGGFFTNAGGVPVNHIARWDGSSWFSLAGGFQWAGGPSVHAMAPYDDGSGSNLIVGGYFPVAGSASVWVEDIARWDGMAWSALSGPSGTGVGGNNPIVSALADYDDGSGPALYAGGTFTTAGGVTVNRIGRWRDGAWSALSGPTGTGVDGTNPRVRALAVYDDGSGPALYAGGTFTTAGGVTVNNIARWDGSAWTSLENPNGTGMNSRVNALAVYDDGSGPALYAGGYFATAGGFTVNRVARWDGSTWSSLAGPSGTGVSGEVYALTVFDDGWGPALYAGGYFTKAGSLTVNRVARWDGSAWSGLSTPAGTGTNSTVSALAVIDGASGSILYVGGDFTIAGGLPSGRIAAWHCVPDTITPSDPTILSSSTHTPGVWSSANVIGVEWSGAVDSGGSGLDGYSVLFDTDPSTVPDDTLEVLHSADPHIDSSGTLADGRPIIFHLRTCDRADNCSDGVHLGPFQVDATSPDAVSDLFSQSHPIGVPTAVVTVDVTWTAAADATSGVAGYGLEFSTSPSWSCDQVQDTTATSSASEPLADGSWYVHVCAVDLAGNWGEVASAGPLVVDASPPVVTLVHSVADTGDGRLEDQEGTRESITQLYISFAEAVHDPAGDIDPDDVTNPDNYLMVATGDDGLFATTSCSGGLAGDDHQVPIDQVVYDGPATTARAWIDAGRQLPRGWYRLLVCGSTSILDLAGNPLDGDGNGVGGDDFRLDIAITATNLLVNPNFDVNLAGWQESSLAEVTWNPDDADQAPTSGSVAIDYLDDDDHLISISQCVAVGDPNGHSVGGRARVGSGRSIVPNVTVSVALFDAPGCGGILLGSPSIPGVGGDTALDWRGFWGWVPAYPNQQSARVTFAADTGAWPGSAVDLDDLFFMEMLFGDGFERGDMSGWSTGIP